MKIIAKTRRALRIIKAISGTSDVLSQKSFFIEGCIVNRRGARDGLPITADLYKGGQATHGTLVIADTDNLIVGRTDSEAL